MAVSVHVITSVGEILRAAHLFDEPPSAEGAATFLATPGHHLLVAEVAGHPVGFVSGVEMRHPDKELEVFVSELGVDEPFRRWGVASALLAGLTDHAARIGAAGLWTVTEPDNTAALATYARAGAEREDTVVFAWPQQA